MSTSSSLSSSLELLEALAAIRRLITDVLLLTGTLSKGEDAVLRVLAVGVYLVGTGGGNINPALGVPFSVLLDPEDLYGDDVPEAAARKLDPSVGVLFLGTTGATGVLNPGDTYVGTKAFNK